MNLQALFAALLFFQLCHFILYGNLVTANEVSISISNKCSFPIWPATAPNTDQPVIAGGGFSLPSGKSKRFEAPSTWSGRLWARTGCNFNSKRKPACETGDCDGRLACDGFIGDPPVTLVQISLDPDLSYYDVSVVDGYNLPVSVSTKPTAQNCSIEGCSRNVNSRCPRELQVLNDKGKVVACKSACLAFNRDIYCCRNEYGSPDKCKPSSYSKIFKDSCPSYYSYAFDNPPPLVACNAKEFVITFCPSKWGGLHMPNSNIESYAAS